MAVKIVTDSTSDILPESKLAKDLGVTVIPLYIYFGTESYRDGVDMFADEFYQRLEGSKSLPTTSAPSPGEIAGIFDKLALETDEILAIMLSSKYSAIYEVALNATEQMKRKCKVEIIDSLTAIGGMAILAINAAKEAREGKSLAEISKMVHSYIPRTNVRMSFDTLEYLRRGGRIGRASALIGSILKVNPILGIDRDGATIPYGRERSRDRAMDWLYGFITSFKNIKDLAIEHATTPDEAEMLIQRIDPIFPRDRIYTFRVGSVVGTHVGPHVIAASVLEG
jgi:DegV family protein with EDD domain